uniref:Multidrug efflux pump subunit AcrB n=1 Tax=Candidatus Kentrum sp. LPFa TaxID=2126335 RepID=A0A450XKR6_9GAMM|nr:MAG: Multidrug efflux pump subunit AcrB [Candidatus Kentron sp. LPFa]VFK29920.1 MAG: Multidrug efflux pump subunit AcrB [Candidatus Kentron sp. LPFa]
MPLTYGKNKNTRKTRRRNPSLPPVRGRSNNAIMIEWFVRNGVAANLLLALILALGTHALFFRLPMEMFPDMEQEMVIISMVFRGATPVEVEEGIVTRVEEAISDLDGIERMIANAEEGRAEVRLEVEKERDPRALLDDIKNRVDAISTFPKDVERPVYSIPQHRIQVIGVVLSADLPARALRELGERARDDLLALPGVGHVDLMGSRPYEIAIEVRQHTLERFGIGFDTIVDAARDASKDYPAGSLKTARGEILLRTEGQAYTGEDFGRIPIIRRADGTHLTLADIAEIEDGFEEDLSYARFNGRPAVLLPIYGADNTNAVDLARDVRRYVEERRGRLPPGIKLDPWFDTSEEIAIWVDILRRNALQGGVAILLILALLLRPSVAGWIFVGIPVSFMGALALMPEFGATINVVTLFALILVLGIVVDDAIVIGENIYTHLRRGEDPTLAAIRGAHEIAVPVTLGVLTTMVAFSSLLLMEGERGVIFGQMGIVVILVLCFSLVESKLILPTHMRHVRMAIHRSSEDTPNGGSSRNRLTRIRGRIADLLEEGVQVFYQPLLARALENRFLTLSLFMGVSFVLVSFVFSGRYDFVFFPEVEGDIAWATLEMPVGTPSERTEQNLARITQAAHGLQEKYRTASGESVIRNIMVNGGWSFMFAYEGQAPHKGEVVLQLAPPIERPDFSNAELIRQWRRATGPIPGAREIAFRFDEQQTSDPIDIQFTGDDFEILTMAAAMVKERLAQYPGVFDIRDSFDVGREEIMLTLRPEAELLGLSVSDLGEQTRQAFFGAEADRFQRGRDDVRVMVRYPRGERASEINLSRMKIRAPSGVEVPLSTVAEVAVGSAYSTIRRIDRHRAVNVTADIDKRNTDVNGILRDMGPFLAEIERRWPGVRHSLEGEQREQREFFDSLIVGVGFVFFTIYALLAIPLRSYAQPIVIMAVIPFSIVGALFGHMVMGLSLSMMSFMGLLALTGVVVNDSLVLVDYINRRVEEGIPILDAARMAGMARFRPILLTSLTTFAGLAPLIFEKSIQAQYLIPMAVSLGFGILYATLLTLFLLPIGYTLLYDARGRFG